MRRSWSVYSTTFQASNAASDLGSKISESSKVRHPAFATAAPAARKSQHDQRCPDVVKVAPTAVSVRVKRSPLVRCTTRHRGSARRRSSGSRPRAPGPRRACIDTCPWSPDASRRCRDRSIRGSPPARSAFARRRGDVRRSWTIIGDDGGWSCLRALSSGC